MPHSPLPRSGLYAVTDTRACAQLGVVRCVRAAIEGGARVVQYRDKSAQQRRREREASALLALCREHAVPFIVNDDVSLARDIGADGVHLGREDGSIADARHALGEQAIIGVSCYHQLSLARAACESGASYIAFGRFFESRTKPGRPLATPPLLTRARQELQVPIAAIGGIDATNARLLIDAGAGLLACIHSVFGQADIAAAARAIQSRFAAPETD